MTLTWATLGVGHALLSLVAGLTLAPFLQTQVAVLVEAVVAHTQPAARGGALGVLRALTQPCTHSTGS